MQFNKQFRFGYIPYLGFSAGGHKETGTKRGVLDREYIQTGILSKTVGEIVGFSYIKCFKMS